MDFPETDCEKRVLNHLGLPANQAIPFGIMQYIQIACRAGFHCNETATRVARLLRWPSILKKIQKIYPHLFTKEEINSDLKATYLQYGSSSGFIKIVADYLTASQRYEKELESLKEKQTKEERKRRHQLWCEMIAQAPTVRHLPFMEELEIDVELFGMSITQAQKELTIKAAEENELLKNSQAYLFT